MVGHGLLEYDKDGAALLVFDSGAAGNLGQVVCGDGIGDHAYHLQPHQSDDTREAFDGGHDEVEELGDDGRRLEGDVDVSDHPSPRAVRGDGLERVVVEHHSEQAETAEQGVHEQQQEDGYRARDPEQRQVEQAHQATQDPGDGLHLHHIPVAEDPGHERKDHADDIHGRGDIPQGYVAGPELYGEDIDNGISEHAEAEAVVDFRMVQSHLSRLLLRFR